MSAISPRRRFCICVIDCIRLPLVSRSACSSWLKSPAAMRSAIAEASAGSPPSWRSTPRPITKETPASSATTSAMINDELIAWLRKAWSTSSR